MLYFYRYRQRQIYAITLVSKAIRIWSKHQVGISATLVTYEKTITHLSEIYRASRIKIDLRVNF